MQREPLLSIIIPTFNCKKDLELTLSSIQEQATFDVELIIIDGGSVDGTLDVIILGGGVISDWVSEPDQGIYDAMNKGIERARGQYLQFLNAGDIFFNNDILARICSELREYSPDVLFGRFHVTDLAYQTIYDLGPKEFSVENLRYYGTGTVNHQAMFIRRDLAPLYSLRYRLKSELNWYIDILSKSPELDRLYVDFPVIKYKVGGAGNLHYKRNLLEWMTLVQRRFGTLQNLKNIDRYRSYLRYIKYIKKFYA